MATEPNENRPPRNFLDCPPVVGLRPQKDTKILLEDAFKDHFGKSFPDIAQRCIRIVLTAKYGGKRVRNIQEQLGVEVK